MSVRPLRADWITDEDGRCRVCGDLFYNGDVGRFYCDNACSMKAYRRRKTDERIGAAAERRRRDRIEHQQMWERFLIDAAKLSKNHAAAVYGVLDGLKRLEGPPWEQLELL